MPREHRTLTFQKDEIIAAVYALADESTRLTLDSPVVAVSPHEGPPITVDLELVDSGFLVLNEAELGAALILYCVQSGVPLPKNANRTLRIEEGNVQLVVRLDDGRTRPRSTKDGEKGKERVAQ